MSRRRSRRRRGASGVARRTLALLALGALGGCGAAGIPRPLPPATPPAAPPPGGLHPEVRQLIDDVNRHRRSRGCPALQWHAGLGEVAQRHSDDMLHRGFYGHVNPDGEDLGARLEQARIRWYGQAAENIARTALGAEQVLYLWLQSPSHRANLENCRLRYHGVGLAGDRWTHVFLSHVVN